MILKTVKLKRTLDARPDKIVHLLALNHQNTNCMKVGESHISGVTLQNGHKLPLEEGYALSQVKELEGLISDL